MKNKGFSLVELIVVIAIMAILVGVAVPVYTSYIDKADEAKDVELLDEINRAFATVCAGEALDINTVTDATIAVADNGAIDLAGMTVKVGDETITTLGAKMVEILGEGLKFNVIDAIVYNAEKHMFVGLAEGEYAYGGGIVKLSAEDIAKLKASAFFTADGLGVTGLLDKVNFVASFAAGVDSTVYSDILGTPEYMKNFLTSVGVDVTGMTNDQLAAAFGTKLRELAAKKAAESCTHNVVTVEDCDECMNAAMGMLLSNATVLYAAQNSGQENGQIIDVLTQAATQEGGCKKSLKDILPENNNHKLQVQVLTNKSESFLKFEISSYIAKSKSLNCFCGKKHPSLTLVSK